MKRTSKRVEPRTHAALVLQGGGALGAYEHGVLRRLFEEPDFDLRYVSGVSIGAITAAVLVGAKNHDPIGTLEALWDSFAITPPPFVSDSVGASLATFGNPAFYRMRTDYFALQSWTSFYDLAPIRRKLAELVDFDAIMASPIRLVVTATNIESGEIEAFGNADPSRPLTVDHILASGSLPPGFPMTVVAGQHYWDGGLFDNTPLSPLLKLIPPEDAEQTRLFVINLFPKKGQVPANMLAVADRIVELIFANKIRKDIDIAETINRFVALIDEIALRHPDVAELLERPEYATLGRYKALADIVEITNTRDEPVNAASDFSRASIEARIGAGYRDADARLAAGTRRQAG